MSWCFQWPVSILLGLMLLMAPAFPAIAADGDSGGSFTNVGLYWENDLLAGTDQDYTQGVKLSLSTPFVSDLPADGTLPSWSKHLFDRLPRGNAPGSAKALSLSLGQKIFTPEDTDAESVVEDERPYAGYTFLSLGCHSRTASRNDVWQLNAGVVGPMSLAEEVQDALHDLTGTSKAEGWDNQLDNEPILEIIYESKWRWLDWRDGSGYGLNIIPHLGGRLGNAAIYANAGAEVRYGYRLPDNFGSCPIRPGCEIMPQGAETGKARLGWFVFASADARLIGRNIFLDGNTFEDSHSVDKKPLVADIRAGAGLSKGRFQLTYAWVLRTKEYDGQDDPQIFGSVNLSFAL